MASEFPRCTPTKILLHFDHYVLSSNLYELYRYTGRCYRIKTMLCTYRNPARLRRGIRLYEGSLPTRAAYDPVDRIHFKHDCLIIDIKVCRLLMARCR